MKWHLILPGDWFVLEPNPFLSLLTRISLLQSRTQTVSQSLFIYVLNRCLAVAAKWDYYTPACEILSNCSFHKYFSSTNLYMSPKASFLFDLLDRLKYYSIYESVHDLSSDRDDLEIRRNCTQDFEKAVTVLQLSGVFTWTRFLGHFTLSIV